MRQLLLAMLGLTGCGRILFDPNPAALDGGGGDTTDASPCTLGPWTMPRLQAATSSTSTEFSPALSSDGLTLYFESDKVGGAGGYDLYVATRATITDDFGPPINSGAVNSAGDDRAPTLTTDGLTLYLQRGTGSPNGRLYRAGRVNIADPFDAPTIVPELASTDVEGPAISPRGDELFFSQGSDMYRATFDGATFSGVAPMTELNTGPSQGYASVGGDGVELYFETTRGDGAFDDVWIARRPAIGAAFVTASREDALSSSGASDSDPEVSRDGRTALIASDRPGGLVAGEFDLYLSTRACQ